MPESAYRSSLGHNHTPVYLCYLGLLWGCKHRDGNCKDFRATKCERFAIWSFRDDAGKPCPRVLWSWAPSGLGHKLTLVPGRVQVSGLLGEVGVVHVTFPPFPFIFFFFIHSTNIWTPVCASHNSSCLKTALVNIRSHDNLQRLGDSGEKKINPNIDSRWVCMAHLSSLLLADRFVTPKCYLATRSCDQGKNGRANPGEEPGWKTR